jgi:katanin p80 WD40 repeat-containing subunit B1
MEIPLMSLVGNSSLVTAIQLHEDELYSGLKGGLVVVWDLPCSKVKYNLQGHSSEVTCLTMAKCEGIPTYLLTSGLDGKIKYWDIRTKSAIANFKGHLSAVKALSISPDLNLIASGSEDGSVRLWDLRTGKLMKEFLIEDQTLINCIEFNPASFSLAYGANDKLIKHWDLNEFSLISVTPVDRLPIQKIKFNYEGTHLFSGTNETLKFWNVDQETTKLEYMAETGWNKLQDFVYLDNDAIYGLNTYGSKIGYWMVPYDLIVTHTSSKAKSDLISDSKKEKSKISKGSKIHSEKDLKDFYSTEAFLNNNQVENVFARNGKINLN